jgi:hypothetical protein
MVLLAAVPARVDDHLDVAQVRNGVERDMTHRLPAEHRRRAHQNHDESVIGRKLDDAIDHDRLSGLQALRKRRR